MNKNEIIKPVVLFLFVWVTLTAMFAYMNNAKFGTPEFGSIMTGSAIVAGIGYFIYALIAFIAEEDNE